MSTEKTEEMIDLGKNIPVEEPDPEVWGKEWEIASEDDLKSGEFEAG